MIAVNVFLEGDRPVAPTGHDALGMRKAGGGTETAEVVPEIRAGG
jgi:hypothetical protein